MSECADRRTIAELKARYELEPSLKDVFVEGPTDRVLVARALSELGDEGRIRAYDIDEVEVPAALLETRSLPVGSKGRVVALADELEVVCSRDLRGSVVCLADLDFDGVLGRCRAYRLLVYTSGLSLDAVLASPRVLAKLLSLVLLDAQPAEGLLRQMLPILNERVLHRIASEELGIASAPPDLTRVCSFDGRTLSCEMDKYVRRFLEKADAVGLEREFRDIVEAHRAEVAAAPQKFIHMEDFAQLLHFCAHKLKPRVVPAREIFRRFMFGCIDDSTLATLPEIREVAARFGLATPAPC